MGLSLEANAKWTRTHAFDCKTLGGGPIDTSFALFNGHISQEMVALCAVSDDDRFLKQNITTLNVHGFDGHTSLRAGAMACRSLWSVTGGSCGSMAQSATFQENYTLRPSLSQWTSSTADFGYLWVRIPRLGAAMSSLRGYFTSD
ncbi:MAG: hypothetical protein L0Y43_05050 [Methylococcaceae bacterium]|nr:hypothetical protein [Methylococcaceae bacterium]